jgi:hypothetical protein
MWTSESRPAIGQVVDRAHTFVRCAERHRFRASAEAEQYLFAYVLRPGNVGASVGALGILSRLLPKLRAAFPRARLRVRLDGGFAAARVFEFLEREGLEYVVAMAKNKVLERHAARLMGTARRRSRESGETEHLYKDCRYAAGTARCAHRLALRPGQHLARTSDEARRLGRVLGAAHRAASAASCIHRRDWQIIARSLGAAPA